MFKKLSLFIGVAFFATALVTPAISYAVDDNEQKPEQTQSEDRSGRDNTKAERERTEKSEKVSEKENEVEKATQKEKKVAENKLKACENRRESAKKIMERISNRGEKQIEVFTKISDRTQEFYKQKGYNVANYDSLVSDVNAKKQAALVATENTKKSAEKFVCSSDNSVGNSAVFKNNLKLQIQAIKDYKTSVKNLIVAVKSANPNKSTGSQESN